MRCTYRTACHAKGWCTIRWTSMWRWIDYRLDELDGTSQRDSRGS
jgi:hypothetical protein